jgi:hypothetical protein
VIVRRGENRRERTRRVKEPRTVEASVIRLLQLWADEMPVTIHRAEVFVGPPDRSPHNALGAEHSTPAELVGGSLLGAPAYAEPMRHLLEDDNPHREEPAIYEGSLTVEKHLVTPLRSAMRRCGRMMEAYLIGVARSGGDWLGQAEARGCLDQHIARVYAAEAFRRLWREYSVDRPSRIPKRERSRHYSDDVPWTEMSESQKAAEDAA